MWKGRKPAVLIFGWGPLPALGPAGAGWGLMLSFGVGSLVLLVYLRSHRSLVTLTFAGASLQWGIAGHVLRAGNVVELVGTFPQSRQGHGARCSWKRLFRKNSTALVGFDSSPIERHTCSPVLSFGDSCEGASFVPLSTRTPLLSDVKLRRSSSSAEALH